VLAKVEMLQNLLKEFKIDGWLIYDFQKKNSIAIEFLKIPTEVHCTRRFFYWIPACGEPVKIVHKIESSVLDTFPGQKKIFFSWDELLASLRATLHGVSKVAMEYFPRGAIPYISLVDGGTIDLIRSMGVEVVSSAEFVQQFTCVLDEAQKDSHLAAAKVLDEVVDHTWQFIAGKLKAEEELSEYQVQQFMISQIQKKNYVFEGNPICAANKNSANPHYCPTHNISSTIRKGDVILIDLWCKQKDASSVYADISRMAIADSSITSMQKEIFSTVRKAQKDATDFVSHAFNEEKRIRGCDVDKIARDVINEAGYGEFFPHRTGHNIYTQDHGPGTHLDSVETYDARSIIRGVCFSIEPGIYMPGLFGMRLEYDVYVPHKGSIQITGGIQNELVTLLSR